MKQSRRMATNKQRKAIDALMSQYCRDDGKGMAVYDPGWDDGRVLAELKNPEPDKPLGIHSIRAWRQDTIGRVRTYTKGGAPAGDTLELKSELEKLRADTRAAVLELRVRCEGQEERLTEMAKLVMDQRLAHEQLVEWSERIVAHLRSRTGYQPPPGRPQSTPPNGT